MIITNSLMGVMSIRKIDGINYNGEEFRQMFNEKLNELGKKEMEKCI